MILPELPELLVLRGAARRLSLRTHVPARALLLGGHRSSQRGRGLEFEEVRAYVPGDDPRSIDWRVTARRGRVHTKLYREERERAVWLLVDLDQAMFFGSRVQLKSMLAVRAAALLAWVAALAGDRVGAIIANSTTIRVLPPRARQAGVLPILNALIELQPRALGTAAGDAVRRALVMLAPLVQPGSLILALSDFAAHVSTDPVRWSALAAHSDCRWVWITDPLEHQALPAGRFRAGNGAAIVAIDGAGSRHAWLNAWRARQTRIESAALGLRMQVLRLDTAQELTQTLAAATHTDKPVA